jgi:YHS domain-containing protein
MRLHNNRKTTTKSSAAAGSRHHYYFCSQHNFLIIVTCLSVSFNAFLYNVHDISSSSSSSSAIMSATGGSSGRTGRTGRSSSGPDNTLYTEFTRNGSSPSDLITTTTTTTTTNNNNNDNNDCDDITTTTTSSSSSSNGMAYHFEATTSYRQSKTLPQWMKGTYLSTVVEDTVVQYCSIPFHFIYLFVNFNIFIRSDDDVLLSTVCSQS